MENVSQIRPPEELYERRKLVKRVYILLLFQVLVISIFVAVAVAFRDVREFHKAYLKFLILPTMLFVIILLLMPFRSELRHDGRYKYICLVVFTLSFGYAIQYVASYCEPKTLLIAGGVAACQFGIGVLLAHFAIFDVTRFTALLIIISVIAALLFISGVGLYLTIGSTWHAVLVELVAGLFGAMVFGFHLLFHQQMTLVNNCQYAYSKHEHIFVAIVLSFCVVGSCMSIAVLVYAWEYFL